jgi:NADH dehydrogenase
MKTKIVIAGGGFGGLYAAKYFDKTLARRDDVEVTLISRENFILFTPMLHEIAAGDLSPSDIVNPLRRILRHVKVIEADVREIDLNARKIRCIHGIGDADLELEYDHLLLALGSETNFFDNQDAREWAVTMKNVVDAALLRNRMVALLEEAALEKDETDRRELLTFVTAGGGFAGAETTGAVNDFLRDTARFYPRLREDMIRVVVVHPGSYLLPELGEELGRYAERKLIERKVEVIKGARVASYDGSVVKLNDGRSIPAVGDCAAVPDSESGQFYPPTAQHGLREGVVAAKNIERTILGQPLEPFRFKTLGLLAAIGHHTGVAMIFGMKFSGFIAWWLWRSVYLLKLPRLAKKLQVVIAWTLDLFFGRDITQIITVRDVEEISNRLARIRARATQQTSTAAASTLGAAVHDQLK